MAAQRGTRFPEEGSSKYQDPGAREDPGSNDWMTRPPSETGSWKLDLSWLLDPGSWIFPAASPWWLMTRNLVSAISPPSRSGRLIYFSPARTRQVLTVNSFSAGSRSVKKKYLLPTERFVNCSVSDRLANADFENRMSPEVSLS